MEGHVSDGAIDIRAVYLPTCNKNQQNAHIYINVLILVSSIRFDHPSVHPQEELYMQFFYISFML